MLCACSKPPYQGPASDHFDGKHFSAPEPREDKSFLTVLKWRLTEHRAKWPSVVAMKTYDTPPATVAGDAIRASFVNHATFLLQTQGLNILTDPIWSERASPLSWWGPKRVHPPGIKWDQLPRIDVVIISHSHYDHFDLPTVKKLVARDNPLFVVPLGIDTLIERAVPSARTQALDWGQNTRISNKVAIYAEPSQHWSARSPWDRNETLWASYVIDTSAGKIYFAGDTAYGSGKVFKTIGEKYGPLRLALIPIGAYEPRWFMQGSHANPHEAVEIFRDLKAQQALGMHYGTFQLTDEAIDQPVKDLAVALDAAKIAPEKFQALAPGEVFLQDRP